LSDNTQKIFDDFREKWIDSIADVQLQTQYELIDFVGENEEEFKRVCDIYQNVLINAAYRKHETGEHLGDCLIHEQKEVAHDSISYLELLLSRAIHHGVKCAYHYKNAQMSNALSELIEANYYLASYRTECCSNLDQQLKRSEIAHKAASERHAPGRAKRERIIEHYQDNRKNLGPKDEAAYKLSKIFNLAPSTIRDYLKGA